MLEGFVADFQITSDQFVDACARGLASDDIDEVRPAAVLLGPDMTSILNLLTASICPCCRNFWNMCLQLMTSSCSSQSW